jgi:hypothetical protein
MQEVEPVDELEAAEVDDLQNAASIPLPEDDVAEVPAPEKTRKSPRKARPQVPHHQPRCRSKSCHVQQSRFGLAASRESSYTFLSTYISFYIDRAERSLHAGTYAAVSTTTTTLPDKLEVDNSCTGSDGVHSIGSHLQTSMAAALDKELQADGSAPEDSGKGYGGICLWTPAAQNKGMAGHHAKEGPEPEVGNIGLRADVFDLTGTNVPPAFVVLLL